MIYVIAGGLSALVCALFVPVVLRNALSYGIVDDPMREPERRVHTVATPLLGGVAIWLSISIVLIGFLAATPSLLATYVNPQSLFGVLVGMAVIMVGGYFDDRYRLPTMWKIVIPLLACAAVVLGGIGVNFITNPFGGVWRIDQLKFIVDLGGGYDGVLNVGRIAFTFAWLSALMFTTKVLDGLDGLVSGITAIGALIIVLLSLRPPVLQYDTALIAAIVAGAFAGFIPFNWSPAKIFLGDGGSMLAGFLLGVLAIIAGGKMATAVLIVAVPLIDLAWVSFRRLALERRSLMSADRHHFHFQLLDLGLRPPQAVLLLYGVTAAVGTAALFLQSRQKLYAILATAFVFLVIVVWLYLRQRRSYD